MDNSSIIGIVLGLSISLPYLIYKIRKVRQEDKEIEWFQSLPLSEQNKIVTPNITSDEVLKERIKFWYNWSKSKNE